MNRRRVLPWLLFSALVPASGLSQTSGDLDPRPYQASPFSQRYFRVDGSGTLPAWKVRVGLDVDYAWRPLVLVDASPSIQASRKTTYDLIQHAVGADLTLALGLGDRFEVGLVAPLTVFQTGETTPAPAGTPGIAGVGNPRLGGKARLWGLPDQGFGAGAAALISLPVGLGGPLTHDSGFGGEVRGFADYRARSWSVGASTGLRLRGGSQLYDVTVGNQITYGVGGELRPSLRTGFLAELAGVTAAAGPFSSTKLSPLEALVGVRHRIRSLWLTAAAGPGLLQGYGSPTVRGVVAVAWSNAPPDADRDGIGDDDDRCPYDPEDKDGFEDLDGCPDPDNDRDGILDAADKCPNDPEDLDKFEDGDGCPDPDNDRDKILDVNDKCPDKPETYNGVDDADGCPDEGTADKDKDGIPDDKDECPEEPEDKDGFEDEDGCPDPDNDKDGIPDVEDKCPNEPETINGNDDEDGCPDKGQSEVRIGKEELETLRPIFFDTDRSRVRHAFHNILGQVALTLKAHPEIGRCAVEGHTDDTGPPEWNQKLSLLRAEAVVEFLVARGVDRKRLAAIGHGEKVAWASNQTPWGRAKNRRVIFHIEGANVEVEQQQERRRRVRARNAAERDRTGAKPPAPAPTGEQPTKPAAPKAAPPPAAPKRPVPSSPPAPPAAVPRPPVPPSPAGPPPAAPTKGQVKPAPTPSKPDVSPAGSQRPAPAPPPGASPAKRAPATTGSRSGAAPEAELLPAPAKTPKPKPGPGPAEKPKTLRELLKLPPKQ